ncbi:hypothetical protein ABK040_006204 [Willaertia magna]
MSVNNNDIKAVITQAMNINRGGGIFMLLSVIMLVVALQLLISSSIKMVEAGELDVALKRMAERCPSMTMRGIKTSCGPNGPFRLGGEGLDANAFNDVVISGLGYDRFTKEMKSQVLKSKSFTTRKDTYYLTKIMQDAKTMYDFFYPMDLSNTFFNGLYSRRISANEVFNGYFKGEMKISAAQKQHLFYNVQVTNNNDLTDEFKYIISLLPDVYNPDIYRKVIDYFGDLVTTNIAYGGVIDQLTSIKACYSDPSMITYIQQQLDSSIDTSALKPPNGYVNYAKVQQLDIVGGNPQEANIDKRIRSFSKNPAPILFNAVPIWTVFPVGTKQNNMKRAYDTYLSEFSQKVATDSKFLDSLVKAEAAEHERDVFIYWGQSSVCRNNLYNVPGCKAITGNCRSACLMNTEVIPNFQQGQKVLHQHVEGDTIRRLVLIKDKSDKIALYSVISLLPIYGNMQTRYTGTTVPITSGCVELNASNYFYGPVGVPYEGVVIKACVRCNPMFGANNCECPKL